MHTAAHALPAAFRDRADKVPVEVGPAGLRPAGDDGLDAGGQFGAGEAVEQRALDRGAPDELPRVGKRTYPDQFVIRVGGPAGAVETDQLQRPVGKFERCLPESTAIRNRRVDGRGVQVGEAIVDQRRQIADEVLAAGARSRPAISSAEATWVGENVPRGATM